MTYCKMSISEKMETINNKIEPNITQYNLDGQTANIFVSSPGNLGKSKFLTSKDVYHKKIC